MRGRKESALRTIARCSRFRNLEYVTNLVPEAQIAEPGAIQRVEKLTAALTASADQHSAAPEIAPLRTAVWRRQVPWAREVALVATVFVVYQWLRGHSPARVELAFDNAALVERVQRWLFIDVELSVNRLFVETPWLADAASVWYQLTHFLCTVGILLWLWVRHRGHYPLLRSTLAATTLLGLAIYWAFPLAPPRFALSGAVDTMHADPVLFAGLENVNAWANLYAAMPSIHVAWAVWCALAVVIATDNPWRHLAWIYPMGTAVVVIGTANHYVLDVVAGVGVVALAFVAVREATLWKQRRVHTRLRPAANRG